MGLFTHVRDLLSRSNAVVRFGVAVGQLAVILANLITLPLRRYPRSYHP